MATPFPRIAFFMAASRFTARIVVGHHQGIFVDHGALDARPWAGIDADLFAREATKQESGAGQDQHGRVGNRVCVAGHQIARQRRRVGKTGRFGRRDRGFVSRPGHV